MENIKFYNVKIGTNTRAGNLNVLQSFVAQSDKNQNAVYIYYRNKYKGFGISVEEVLEIVKDEIPTLIDTSTNCLGRTPEQIEIQKLKEELKKQNTPEFNYFNGIITWNHISTEVTEGINEMEEINKLYHTKKREIEKKIVTFITEKYGNLLVAEASLGEWTHETRDIPFKVKLKGKITSTNNEL